MDKTLAGRVALITGSGRGLGYAVARRLAELGADVAIHDISQEAPAEFGEARNLDDAAARLKGLGGRCVGVVGDVSVAADVERMVRQTESALGPINILVNAAGGDIAARGGKPQPNNGLGVKPEDLRAIMERNFVGTVLVCQRVCPGMVQRGGGAVVNFGSIAAHFGVTDGVAYAAAKAAVVHYTRCLAAELRPHGVRVNAISPGPTRTARFLVTRPLDPVQMDDSRPLDRYGKPEEIADAVAFMVSDASRFMSGQVIRIDGGLQLFPA